MDTRGSDFRIRYFSDERVKAIHSNALDILESTGIQVEHPEALELLRAAGAAVDFDKSVVKINPDLVQKCIDSARHEVSLAARNPERDVTLRSNPRVPVARNGGGVDNIIDLETGEFRPMVQSDIADLFRVLDALDNISYVAPLYAQDAPGDIRDVVVFESLVNNTSKHVNIRTFSTRNLEAILTIAEIVAGGKENLKSRPIFSLFDSPVSPLKFPELVVDVFLTAARNEIPVHIGNMPIAGATGPFTLAGEVLLLYTELLGGIVICETANPGAPVILSPHVMTMDMSTLLALTGSIEVSMIMAGITQMIVERLRMPADIHGPWSDSMVADSESMLERTFGSVLPAYAGASVIAGAGDIQEGFAYCPVQLGMDDELLGFLFKSLEGIPADTERLAAEAIKRNGFAGDYMTDDTTIAFLRSDYYQPTILNRSSRERWTADGKKDMNDRARERIQTLIQDHKPIPLDEDCKKEIRKVVESLQ